MFSGNNSKQSLFNVGQTNVQAPSLIDLLGVPEPTIPGGISVSSNQPAKSIFSKPEVVANRINTQNSAYFPGVQKLTSPNDFLKFTSEYVTIITEGYRACAQAQTSKHLKEIELTIETATNCTKLCQQAKQIRLLKKKCANQTQKQTDLTKQNAALKAEIQRLKKNQQVEKKNPFMEGNVQPTGLFQTVNPFSNIAVSSTPLFSHLMKESYEEEKVYLNLLQEKLSKISALINDPEYKTTMAIEDVCLLDGKTKALSKFHKEATGELDDPLKGSSLFIGSQSTLFNSVPSSGLFATVSKNNRYS